MDVRVRKTLIVYHFSLHFHKMSLVLTSLHPSSLELRYLVPPCPGVSSRVVVCCAMRECVWCDKRALVARLCRPSPFRLLRRVEPGEDSLLALSAPSLGRKGEQGFLRSCKRIPQYLPISWSKSCPSRKILTNHRCIKSCLLMPRHGATQNGKVFGSKTFQA